MLHRIQIIVYKIIDLQKLLIIKQQFIADIVYAQNDWIGWEGMLLNVKRILEFF